MSLFTDRIAEFSPCRKYRYWLEIVWDREASRLGWLMLNPSTADEIDDDPTLRKCQGFARHYGYGGVIVCNIYGLRSTDPKGLWKVDDPVGPDNYRWIDKLAVSASRIVGGWGTNARPADVDRALHAAGAVWCLNRNKDGSPQHPLYVPYSQPVTLYHAPTVAPKTITGRRRMKVLEGKS